MNNRVHNDQIVVILIILSRIDVIQQKMRIYEFHKWYFNFVFQQITLSLLAALFVKAPLVLLVIIRS